MTEALPRRKDVDPALTWDLSAIYPDQTAFEQDFKDVQALTNDFERMYTGQLNRASTIIDALGDYENILTKLDRISHWGFMPYTTDTTNADLAAQLNRVDQLAAKIAGQISFVESELKAQPQALLADVAGQAPDFASYMRHLEAQADHRLDPHVEKALAELGPTLAAPSKIRDQAIFGDMDFGTFTAHGQEYPLSFVSYEETYQNHPDTEIRRNAYAQFNKTLRRYQSTMATAYYTQVSTEKTLATMAGYDSVIDYLLADQEVTRDMFNRQIDVIMTELAPVMRRYVTYVKEVWGLDYMGYADLQIDLDPDYAPTISIEDSKQYVSDAVAIMGQAYHDRIMASYPERWTDFPANQGKDSGAYTAGPYGVHPYVMMSWSDSLPSLYTLIHELGHTGQMTLAQEHHGYLAAAPSMYVVESPSTFHELLMTHSLEEKATDNRLKRFALSRLLGDTYFHNFITHLLEAAFQREVYKLIDAGESFDAARLNQIKRQVLTDFWGDAVKLEEGAELTWMRQSHYYMGLYSYTYSAGLTVSTQAYLRVLNEGQPAIDAWLNFLALGDSLNPIDSAKVAGVDVTTAEPLHNTIKFLNDTVDEIIDLGNHLD
ncbi:oligoendopeptidase F [Lacticaseibacillus brantae]|uniref:Oligopeptidase F n=1 Tax=Lacticaseibacillus brantae DSM 23927 TaxID=1423727 RepID=A0A0R2AZI8_9LACO|nr:oligoendopeptidase F [Lacticaseibacillus brantae]KRM71954.1 M3 family oligoendopeptidase F [Lacticaseibacillus brantae DSM 23927]